MYKAQHLPLLLQEKTYSCLQIWQEFNAEHMSTYQAGTFRETSLSQQDLQMPHSNLAPVVPSVQNCLCSDTHPFIKVMHFIKHRPSHVTSLCAYTYIKNTQK